MKFAAKNPGTSSSAAGGAEQTLVQADPRTNSLVVRDTPENIERMKKLIEILDTQTAQVLIEAKIVATEEFTKGASGTLSMKFNDAGDFFAGFPPSAVFHACESLISAPQTGANGGVFGLSLGILPNGGKINALLNIGETEHTVKVVSSPRTWFWTKSTRRLSSPSPFWFLHKRPRREFRCRFLPVVPANLSLNVQPTVTNEGSVLMQLTLTRDVPQQAASGSQFGVANRNMTTRVLVDSGSTLVIGGVYSSSADHQSSGFPVLRKIPLIGWLFGSESDNNSRTELFFLHHSPEF